MTEAERERVAAHEASHATAGLMLGLPVLEATITPERGVVHFGGAGLELGKARLMMIATVCCPLAEGRPPPSWPPSEHGPKDERLLRELADFRGDDAKTYREIVREAHELVTDPDFMRIESGIASLLEEGHTLDGLELKHVKAIASKETPMLHKTKEATTTTRERGEFSAIAAAWTVDRQNERIERGAFLTSILNWRTAQRNIPLHWSHQGEAHNVIGVVDPASLEETSEGLRVKGRLHLEDSETARHAWRLMKDDALALSFGYLVTESHKDADGVTVLTALDLFEISLTPSPANPNTRILGMKSLDTPDLDLPADLFEPVHRSDLASDGVDEKQLHEWEKGCAEDMREARPVQVKTFKC